MKRKKITPPTDISTEMPTTIGKRKGIAAARGLLSMRTEQANIGDMPSLVMRRRVRRRPISRIENRYTRQEIRRWFTTILNLTLQMENEPRKTTKEPETSEKKAARNGETVREFLNNKTVTSHTASQLIREVLLRGIPVNSIPGSFPAFPEGSRSIIMGPSKLKTMMVSSLLRIFSRIEETGEGIPMPLFPQLVGKKSSPQRNSAASGPTSESKLVQDFARIVTKFLEPQEIRDLQKALKQPVADRTSFPTSSSSLAFPVPLLSPTPENRTIPEEGNISEINHDLSFRRLVGQKRLRTLIEGALEEQASAISHKQIPKEERPQEGPVTVAESLARKTPLSTIDAAARNILLHRQPEIRSTVNRQSGDTEVSLPQWEFPQLEGKKSLSPEKIKSTQHLILKKLSEQENHIKKTLFENNIARSEIFKTVERTAETTFNLRIVTDGEKRLVYGRYNRRAIPGSQKTDGQGWESGAIMRSPLIPVQGDIVYRKPAMSSEEVITETKRQIKTEKVERETVVNTVRTTSFLEQREEVQQVAEKVYDLIEKRLKIEQERRGR